METMNTLYAMITKNCNLSCKHCDIKSDDPDNYNENVFVDTIQKFNGEVILFGGEPSLHEKRIKKVLQYANSISTNLLDISDEFISFCNHLNVATSWNPTRFSNKQFATWINNVKRLKNKPALLITLTPDLICDTTYFNFFKNNFDGLFNDIVFEQLISDNINEEYFNKVDKWLVLLKKYWNMHMKSCSTTLKRKEWLFDCSHIKTLYPDGTLKNGCPQYTKVNIVNKCYPCNYVNICKPCVIQKECSCPIKLLSINKK